MQADPLLSSGVEAFDRLIEGVRVGDNLVVLLDTEVPAGWLVDRYVAAADASRLVVADAHGNRTGAHVLDWSDPDLTPEVARRQLRRADERVGTGAAVAIDSLSLLARRWGDQAALDLFLWACPRLFRRRSVALWLLCSQDHDEAFVRRLTAITQVVVRGRGVGDGIELEVVKADGRSAAVRGRRLLARVSDGALVDVRPGDVERQRLAAHLREVRTRRGIGQAELARRVGISPSALSQAERGVRAVSAETLMRVWETLGLPLGPDAFGRGYRVHRRGGQSTATLAPGVSGRQRSQGPALTVWQLTFAPRASGRTPLFAVKAVETVLVLRGVLQAQLQHLTETLQEGDTLVAETAAITAWENPADTAAEVLWLLGEPR